MRPTKASDPSGLLRRHGFLMSTPSNDTAVQRRVGEGAKRPNHSSDCNGGLAGVVDAPEGVPLLVGHHPPINGPKDTEQTMRIRALKEYEGAPVVQV